MARRGFAFNQRDASSLSSECDRSGTACHSPTKDQNFVLQNLAPNSLDVPSICSGAPYSSRRPNSSLTRHSVQIVILEPAEPWLDGCICRVKFCRIHQGIERRSVTTGRELVPVWAEVDVQQRRNRERNHANAAPEVAQM